MEKERISIAEAAKILGCNQEAIRQHIRKGIWDFGEVIPKKKTGKKRDQFFVYRRKLYRHLGIEREEADHDEKKTQTA